MKPRFQPERIIDGYFFDDSLSEREQSQILNSCLFFLQGVRDLDLIAELPFLKRMAEELNFDSPIIYLRPEQMASVRHDHPVRVKLSELIARAETLDQRKKAKDQLGRLDLFRDIIAKSLSVIDLGLLRRIEVLPNDEQGEGKVPGRPNLSLKITYCLTTDKCPHNDVFKKAMAEASIDIYKHLKAPKSDKVPKLEQLTGVKIFQEPGDPWSKDDLAPEIVEILGGKGNVRMPYQDDEAGSSEVGGAKSSLNIVNS